MADILDPNSEAGQQIIRNAAFEKPLTPGDPPEPERELDADAASAALSRAFQALRKRDTIDERFRPIVRAMDGVIDRYALLAGEQIYMLCVLLLGSVEDAPAEVRELFRGAVVQALLKERDSGRVLRELCLEGQVSRS